MPRSRGSEMSTQRQSPRVPLHLKTTAASEANSLHRPATDRSSPKPDDHRSLRSGPLHEKKRGTTRVAELETKLGQMQEELKKVKDQLASAEAARLDARQELEEAKKQSDDDDVTPSPAAPEEENRLPSEEPETQHQDLPEKIDRPLEPPATDVFEVVPPAAIPAKTQEGKAEEDWTMIQVDGTNGMMKSQQKEEEANTAEFPEDPEISELRAKLAVKEEELEIRSAENETLKKQATEAAENARAKEEELGVKLLCMEEEVRESKSKAERLREQLEAAEGARAALEAEMKRLNVQSEQWRKAAEAAAAVLASGDGMGTDASGRRVAERCGSMDKQHLGGYRAGWSPLMGGEEMDEEGPGGAGKRKGAGIRMFGDLWRKKGQQQGKN